MSGTRNSVRNANLANAANIVMDLSHHNTVSDWGRVRAAGIVAVIHKASEGTQFRDKTYLGRRDAARAAGLLWGSYHFSSGGDAVSQAEHYLAVADAKDDELLALDFEPSSGGPNMRLDQAEEFVQHIMDELGRAPVIYGGHMLREALAGVSSSPLAQCPLWYARYAPRPSGIPPIWPTFTLWQYTDGNVGSEPQDVDGVGSVDRDKFNGTEAELRARWPLTPRL